MKNCCDCKILQREEEFYKVQGKLYPRCKGCEKQRQKDKRKRGMYSDKDRRYYLKKTFGISLDDYNQMFADQQGCCKICGKHQTELSKTLHVDHCHKTGRIRGLLCMQCNAGLGNFYDNPEYLDKAKEYLKC